MFGNDASWIEEDEEEDEEEEDSLLTSKEPFRMIAELIFEKKWLPTHQQTDGRTSQRTYGWTDPLIEMRGRI